jgi:hypothetical protein
MDEILPSLEEALLLLTIACHKIMKSELFEEPSTPFVYKMKLKILKKEGRPSKSFADCIMSEHHSFTC